jgi:hypothetical protein
MVLTRTALAFAASASTLGVVGFAFSYLMLTTLQAIPCLSHSRKATAGIRKPTELDGSADKLMCCCCCLPCTASTIGQARPSSNLFMLWIRRRRQQLPHARTNQPGFRQTGTVLRMQAKPLLPCLPHRWGLIILVAS